MLGGSSGIGLATAQAAAREGAKLVIASSRKARLDEALATLPTGTEGQVLDLADGDATKALFAKLGDFDHLVYTAGETLQLGPLATTDIEPARRFFTLRYWGAYCAAKYGSGHIRKGGSIVFTSGIAGKAPACGLVARRQHLFGHGGTDARARGRTAPIRVNIVSPGVVRTPLWANMTEADRKALYQQMADLARQPRRRRGGDRCKPISTSCGRATAPVR